MENQINSATPQAFQATMDNNINPSVNPPPKPPFLQKKMIIIIGIVAVGIALIIGIILFVSNNSSQNTTNKPKPTNSSTTAGLSGEIDLNGIIPTGSTISVLIRPAGSGEYKAVVSGIVARDKVPWKYASAKSGTMYEIKAQLLLNGNTLAESSPIIVAAPATEEIITINSEGESSETGSISGILDINGVIPQGSTVSVGQRPLNNPQGQFTIVATGINAVDGAPWTFTNASVGDTYEIQAYLISQGSTVAQSNIKPFTAPAKNEILTINIQNSTSSSVTPTTTPQPATITGTINLNGTIPPNSTISVAQRVTGTQQFSNFVSGLSAANGISWTFTNANAGTSYDLQASLLVNGVTAYTSNILTIPAPAANEVLSINAVSNLSAPTSAPSAQCVSVNSSNLWNVTLTYKSIPGAVQYWIQLGTSSNISQFLNTQVTQNSSSAQTFTITSDYVISSGVSYFAQYSYATSSTANTSFGFSSWSPTLTFTCSAPTNTPTPTPTPTNTPTPIP